MAKCFCMKRKKNFIALLVASVFAELVLCSCSKKVLAEDISIFDGGKEFKFSENKYIFLEDENFDIRFNGLKPNQNIYLFAYHNDSFIDKYKLPVKADDTDIFNLGMAMAERTLDKEKGYTLTTNEIHSMHCIGDDRRLNDSKGATIPVRSISDATGFMDDRVFLLFYVDYKHNRIIEPNELAWIELILPYDSRKVVSNASPADFAKEKRAYVSSSGHRINKENYHGNEFKAYKIVGKSDIEKMLKKESRSFKNIDIGQHVYGLESQKEKFSQPTIFLMVPQGLSLCNNPFRIKGDKTIYFEVQQEENQEYIDKPVSVRFLRLRDEILVDKIAFYYDGKVIPVEVADF